MKKLITLLAVVAVSATMLWAEERTKEVERIQAAGKVLNEIMAAPDKGIPVEILGAADCVAIVPSMLKGGFVVGGNYGKGVATCRTTGNRWSAPAPIRIEGGSFGLQIGGQAVDLVMLVMNKDGMQNLLQSKFKIGVDASAAAGPVGRHAEGSTDWKMRAQVLTYSRARGAFAGVSLNGAVIKQDTDDTVALYGKDTTFESILTGKVPPPAGTQPFLAEVAKYFREAKAGESASARSGQAQTGTAGGTAAAAAAPEKPQSTTAETAGGVAGSTHPGPRTSTGTTTETTTPQAGMTGAGASSDQVQANIEKALSDTPGLSVQNVNVNVTDDAVTVSGSVPTEKDKVTIRRIAEQNSGGRKVDDSNLAVK